ncbi:hypothetical protein [Actinomadura monticuli]|uniref:Uncharacterized protein n=1 Tax=Actinomadura monticuli TaxID=3097367 RepID=A0ABV4QJ63_9ACTN
MTDDGQDENSADRWRTLPPHISVADTVASQEVPPKPQVIAEPLRSEIDEATRYPI